MEADDLVLDDRPVRGSIGVDVRAVQQLGAETGGPRRRKSVEGQRGRLAVRRPGADLDLHQAEDALQRVCAHVDGANPVARDGQPLAGDESAADLDRGRSDAVAGGEPTCDAESDDDDGGRCPVSGRLSGS